MAKPKRSSRGNPVKKAKRSKTQRGFWIYDQFVDLNNSKIRIQESSLATERAVWIFANNDNPELDGDPHLTTEQARRVIKALQSFVDDR